jgi:hypothetical protein
VWKIRNHILSFQKVQHSEGKATRFLIVCRDGIPYRLVSDENWEFPADITNLPFIEETDEVVGHWVAPERREGQEKEDNKKQSKQAVQEKGGRVYGISDALRRMLEEWGEKLEWEEEWKWEEQQEIISADYVDEKELELVSCNVYDDEARSADGEAELRVVGSTKFLEDAYVIELVTGRDGGGRKRWSGVRKERSRTGKRRKRKRFERIKEVWTGIVEEGEGAGYGNMDEKTGIEEKMLKDSQKMGMYKVEEKKEMEDVWKDVEEEEIKFEDRVVE